MKKAIYLLGILSMLTACEESKDDDTPGDSNAPKEELLAGSSTKDWTLSRLVVNGGDTYPLLKICEKDNIYRFNRDNSAELLEGATKCQDGDPDAYPGTWSFYNNQTQIITNLQGNIDTSTILELTKTTLRVSRTKSGNQIETTFKVK